MIAMVMMNILTIVILMLDDTVDVEGWESFAGSYKEESCDDDGDDDDDDLKNDDDNNN